MPLTIPCTACEGSGISRSLQSNWLSDDCDTCRGSGQINVLCGRKRFAQGVLEDGTYRIEYASAYAERGYNLRKGQAGILFANWNDETRYDEVRQERVTIDDFMPRFEKIAEAAGYECEWSDEWSTCSDCYKAFRTQPDSNGWTPSYDTFNGEDLCVECIRKDARNYVASYNGRMKKIPIDLGDKVLKSLGWKEAQEYRLGIEDDIKKIAQRLQAAGFKKFLFTLTSTWVRKQQADTVAELLETGSVSLRTIARQAQARRKQQRKQKSFER